MAGARLYGSWGSLTEGLRTGQPQNEAKQGGNFFSTIYADPPKLHQFLSAMTGLTMGSAIAIAKRFPWRNYKTFMDIAAGLWSHVPDMGSVPRGFRRRSAEDRRIRVAASV